MTKEEKKNEMKNRISMALKDPILQQGFEIICKENAILEQQIEQMQDAKCISCTDLGGMLLKITDLEKQLTKAKEIIKDLLRLPYANDWEVYGDVTSHLDKAEQFLKEENCPDCLCEDCTKEDCTVRKLGLVEK